MEGIITAVEPQARRGGARVNVFVDGRYAFSLQRDLADLVRVGEPISELKTAELLVEDEQARALEAGLAFLAYRPRSEREVRDRLKRKEVPEPVVEAVIERLRSLGSLGRKSAGAAAITSTSAAGSSARTASSRSAVLSTRRIAGPIGAGTPGVPGAGAGAGPGRALSIRFSRDIVAPPLHAPTG